MIPFLLALIVPFTSSPSAGPITITCPEEAKVTCGESTHPDITGYATATSDCATPPVVTYVDDPMVPMNCAADRFYLVVTRHWTATDACGNTATCDQLVVEVRQAWDLDVMPGSCPNLLEVGSSGASTITLAVAGTTTQSVADIDLSSVLIWREGCAFGSVTPASVSLADVTRPYAMTTQCGCQSLGADGRADLRITVSRAALVSALHLNSLSTGDSLRLVVSGSLADGCEFVAVDCIQVANSDAEGCSPGYWKNHPAAWATTGYTTGQDFDTVFGVNAFVPNRTLLAAVGNGGGGVNALGRQAVAALLNAGHPTVEYPFTQAQVIQLVHDAITYGTVEATKNLLESYNGNCPL